MKRINVFFRRRGTRPAVRSAAARPESSLVHVARERQRSDVCRVLKEAHDVRDKARSVQGLDVVVAGRHVERRVRRLRTERCDDVFPVLDGHHVVVGAVYDAYRDDHTADALDGVHEHLRVYAVSGAFERRAAHTAHAAHLGTDSTLSAAPIMTRGSPEITQRAPEASGNTSTMPLIGRSSRLARKMVGPVPSDLPQSSSFCGSTPMRFTARSYTASIAEHMPSSEHITASEWP